jgi:hypothetical protein
MQLAKALTAIAVLMFATSTFALPTEQSGQTTTAHPQQQTPPDCVKNPKDPRCKKD